MSRVHIRFDEAGEIAEYKLRPTQAQGFKAMMLAPTLELCRALLRGESVPLELLDPEQVARYGLRPTG